MDWRDKGTLQTLKPMLHSLEKVAARVALECIKPSSVVNFGFGLPSSVMYIACTEEKMMDLVTSALEIGIIGGVPGVEQQFALCANADAVIPSDYMFDNIWGAESITRFSPSVKLTSPAMSTFRGSAM